MAEEAGFVDIFETMEIGGDRVTVLRQIAEGETGFVKGEGERSRTTTIVLRGATSNHLDDLERAIDDGVNVLKALLKDGRLVPGAGATELELAKRVDSYGSGLKGLSQHAVKRYSQALEVVPRTLAENALGALEGNELLSRLWAKHNSVDGSDWGVDVEVSKTGHRYKSLILKEVFQGENDGTLLTSKRGILDSLVAKSWAIKLATQAAISVLSVDSIIMSKPAGGPKIPQQSGNWDED
jgi:chaperonin GroEL (HSP60 family)